MTPFEIYILGWIVWVVCWHFTEDAHTGLIMGTGLFWPIIAPIGGVVYLVAVASEYLRDRKRKK